MAQNFENHTKIVPAFHYFVLPVLAINLGRSIYRVAHQFSGDAVISVLLAAALILLALYARMFALTVQDRVIRLEMQLRLHNLLAARSASSHRGFYGGPVSSVAIRERCGVAGACAESVGRKIERPQDHQEDDSELAD